MMNLSQGRGSDDDNDVQPSNNLTDPESASEEDFGGGSRSDEQADRGVDSSAVEHTAALGSDDSERRHSPVATEVNEGKVGREEDIDSDSGSAEIDWDRDPYLASPNSKYERYAIRVAHEEGDRGLEIRLCSFKRPHMRALHCAWISFFLAFTVWVSPAPLLKEIATTLNLTKKQVWTSSITNDVAAILLRIVIGPVCDAHGARIPMAVVLVLASIPTAMLGLVNSATGLAVCRFFIGIAGSSFVMSQSWPSRMFSRELTGTANGLVGGWGNLGGAFAQLLMGFILFPLFRDYVYDGDASKSWRTIPVIPAAMALVWGCIVAFISDDSPMGNYAEMKRLGTMDRVYYTTSLRSGAKLNTWILYVQYACCFGVEIAMNNAAVLYFSSEFGLSTEQASTLGFAYGSMNIFARGLGGYLSDHLNFSSGLRGRLWLQTILLVCEGALIIAFSYSSTLPAAITTMCLFSFFTQSSEGAIFGVVPYVSKLYTGSVSGLVGSGGNLGSVVYGVLFRSMPYRAAFLVMGSVVVASSVLSAFIRIPCHASMLWGKDNHAVIQARQRFLLRKEIERAQVQRDQMQRESGDRGQEQQQPSNGDGNGDLDEREQSPGADAEFNGTSIEDEDRRILAPGCQH
jgi:MFS transporter, NNP family, nitrate/nitrite transporter